MVSDDGHRAGQGEFQFALGMRAGGLRFHRVHAALQPQWAGHDRHHRLVAVVADSHLDLVLEIDALDPLEKSVHEMLARLLAVADDVDAAVFLQLDRENGGVALAAQEIVAGKPPWRPQPVGLGKPGGFRQRAGDGGLEHMYDSQRGGDFRTRRQS